MFDFDLNVTIQLFLIQYCKVCVAEALIERWISQFCTLFPLFFILMKNYVKIMISTSERHAKHPFADQNTPHINIESVLISFIPLNLLCY